MEIPQCLERGNGGLKYYEYWTGGIKLKTKETVLRGLELRLRVLRKDKITMKVESFNYDKNNFEVVK